MDIAKIFNRILGVIIMGFGYVATIDGEPFFTLIGLFFILVGGFCVVTGINPKALEKGLINGRVPKGRRSNRTNSMNNSFNDYVDQ